MIWLWSGREKGQLTVLWGSRCNNQRQRDGETCHRQAQATHLCQDAEI